MPWDTRRTQRTWSDSSHWQKNEIQNQWVQRVPGLCWCNPHHSNCQIRQFELRCEKLCQQRPWCASTGHNRTVQLNQLQSFKWKADPMTSCVTFSRISIPTHFDLFNGQQVKLTFYLTHIKLTYERPCAFRNICDCCGVSQIQSLSLSPVATVRNVRNVRQYKTNKQNQNQLRGDLVLNCCLATSMYQKRGFVKWIVLTLVLLWFVYVQTLLTISYNYIEIWLIWPKKFSSLAYSLFFHMFKALFSLFVHWCSWEFFVLNIHASSRRNGSNPPDSLYNLFIRCFGLMYLCHLVSLFWNMSVHFRQFWEFFNKENLETLKAANYIPCLVDLSKCSLDQQLYLCLGRMVTIVPAGGIGGIHCHRDQQEHDWQLKPIESRVTTAVFVWSVWQEW